MQIEDGMGVREVVSCGEYLVARMQVDQGYNRDRPGSGREGERVVVLLQARQVTHTLSLAATSTSSTARPQSPWQCLIVVQDNNNHRLRAEGRSGSRGALFSCVYFLLILGAWGTRII